MNPFFQITETQEPVNPLAPAGINRKYFLYIVIYEKYSFDWIVEITHVKHYEYKILTLVFSTFELPSGFKNASCTQTLHDWA